MNQTTKSSRIAALLAALCVLTTALSACTQKDSSSVSEAPTTSAAEAETLSSVAVCTVKGSELVQISPLNADEKNGVWDEAAAAAITLDGKTAKTDASGVSVDGATIRITAGGTYVLSGTLTDGQVVVNTTEKVQLVLNGASITSTTTAPICVEEAKKLILTLADGTENTLTDSDTYTVFSDEAAAEPNAALFSKGDLILNGSGSLKVNANYANGIQSKDSLCLAGATVTVTAKGDGIKGKDFVYVDGADLTVDADGDGIQASNTTDGSLGYVVIQDGTFSVQAEGDGIQAQTCLCIAGGELDIVSGGGSANATQTHDDNPMNFGGNKGAWGQRSDADSSQTTSPAAAPTANTVASTDSSTTSAETDTVSTKGLKANAEVYIVGGTINVDAADDAIHSNDTVNLYGGTITASAGDDGVHGSKALNIESGTLDITKSYEGLEGAVITISGGNTRVTASDDGVNASDGTGSVMGVGKEGCSLTITDGYLYVDAGGDGLDSNNTMTMTGGTVLVNGPENGANGALDSETGIFVNGGLLIAAGASGMAEAPESDSTQYAVHIGTETQAADTLVSITDQAGNVVAAFAPAKSFSSLILSSPDLKQGETYTVTLGGSCSGNVQDGRYDGGSCSGGTALGTFTASDILSTVGTVTGGFGNRGNHGNFSDGEVPQMPNGEMPSGGRPEDGQMPVDGTRPARPSGAAPDGSFETQSKS